MKTNDIEIKIETRKENIKDQSLIFVKTEQILISKIIVNGVGLVCFLLVMSIKMLPVILSSLNLQTFQFTLKKKNRLYKYPLLKIFLNYLVPFAQN